MRYPGQRQEERFASEWEHAGSWPRLLICWTVVTMLIRIFWMPADMNHPGVASALFAASVGFMPGLILSGFLRLCRTHDALSGRH